MAKMTRGTVLLEVSAAELDLILRGLKVLKDYAEYNDQADLDALTMLRSDLSVSAHG